MLKCKGHPDVRHCDCGGQIAVSGHGYQDLPEGFGFPDYGNHVGHFVVDLRRYKIYEGFCSKCKASGCFIRTDQKPKRIRKKLKVSARK